MTHMSTVGRPRTVTDKKVAIILQWHEMFTAWKLLRSPIPSMRELACELELSKATILKVIRRRGEFKQPSPELRGEVQSRRRQRMRQLRSRAR
jgi:transposase